MSRSNPTRTRTIEAAWLAEINRRWRRFTRAVVARLESDLLTNAEDVFEMSAAQQRTYMAYLDGQISAVLLADDWQARYQLEAYRRGLETTRASLLAQGSGITPSEAERLAAQGIASFSAVPSLGTAGSALTAPIHLDAFAFLQGRAFDKLTGWTDVMSGEVRQVLFDSVAEGRGIRTTVRDMRARIDVSRSRARLIARTEVNQAYGRAAISEVTRASGETGVDIELRWITVRDTKVRHLHARWHGVVMTAETASANKNASPWNCRCGFAPVVPDADTPAKQAEFAAQRAALLALEAQDAA